MLGIVEDLVARAFLDDAALLHDDDAVGDLLDHAEIMADEQAGEAVLALQFREEFEHLRAHRDVERRDRLVGDDEARPAHHGAGDRDALALAAGELVRIALGEAVAQADLGQHLGDARLLVGLVMPGTSRSGSATSADRHARIERGIRILEHHLAVQPVVPIGRLALEDRLAVEQDLAAGRLDQPGDGLAERGLARARAADHGHDLARPAPRG
jgi:hypothetical protein